MENSRLISTVIGLAVVIIVIATVLSPTILDSSKSFSSIEQNESPSEYYAYSTGAVTVEHTKGEYPSLNGVSYDTLMQQNLNKVYVIQSDAFYIGFGYSSANSATWSNILFYDGYFHVEDQSDYTMIVAADGSYTFTAGSVVRTGTVSWILYPVLTSDQADYAYYSSLSSKPVWVDRDAKLIALASSATTSTTEDDAAYYAVASGTYDDLDLTLCKRTPATGSNPTFTTGLTGTATIGYGDSSDLAVELTSAQFTYGGATYDFGRIFVPLEYHVVTSSDDAQYSLLQAIPLFVVIAVLIGAVSLIIRRD